MGDLGSSDCANVFKNQYESTIKLTRESLVLFYDDLIRKFSKVRQPEQNAHAKVNVKVINENAGLLSVTPCVLQQFKFANQGKNFEAIQKSVLDLTKLVQWD